MHLDQTYQNVYKMMSSNKIFLKTFVFREGGEGGQIVPTHPPPPTTNLFDFLLKPGGNYFLNYFIYVIMQQYRR